VPLTVDVNTCSCFLLIVGTAVACAIAMDAVLSRRIVEKTIKEIRFILF
jgi:hypothetical protein